MCRFKDFFRTAWNVKYRRISSREWRIISYFFFLFLFFLWSFMRSMSSGVLERLRILSRLKPTKVLTWREAPKIISMYSFLVARDDDARIAEENLRARKQENERWRAEKTKRKTQKAISPYVAFLSETYSISSVIYTDESPRAGS